MEVAVNPLRGVHDEQPLQRRGGERERERWSNRVHNRLLLQSSLHATG